MTDDTISRQAAIDALNGCTEIFLNNLPPTIYKTDAVEAVTALPSAQPVNIAKLQPNCNQIASDCISREAAIDEFLTELTKRERTSLLHTWSTVEVKYFIAKILEQLPSAQLGWIPCSERLPENEHEVMVTVEVRPIGCKPRRRVIKAFYTDGKHTDADSAYTWYELEEPDGDDDGNIIIPEGWWEAVDYSDEFNMIDDFVVAWCEPLKPWEGGQDV